MREREKKKKERETEKESERERISHQTEKDFLGLRNDPLGQLEWRQIWRERERERE